MAQVDIKLAIWIMAYGQQVSAHHPRMWMEFGQAVALHKHVEVVQSGYLDVNPVDRARNTALALSMTANANWLLMVDADTFVVSGGGLRLVRMIDEADLKKAAIVVAPVMSRSASNPHLMAYQQALVGDGLRPITTEPVGRLVPIDSAATAIMAVHLPTIATIDAQFRFVDATPTRPGMSEDHEFCRQVREAGGKLYCDTRVVTGHMARPQPIFSGPTTYAQAEIALNPSPP